MLWTVATWSVYVACGNCYLPRPHQRIGSLARRVEFPADGRWREHGLRGDELARRMSHRMTVARRSLAGNGRGVALPLPLDAEIPRLLERSGATPSLFEDTVLRQLIRSRPVQRLRRIGFLGAIDRIKSRFRHNRYDHSLGVARLALLYAKSRNLSQHDTRVLAAAGLLHDVGHGPLSHTLEPIFQERFGISHHKAGVQIIRGESALGREIPEVLACHGLDPDEVNAMIGGTHNGRHAFLFSSPINLDTIEGVTRCFSFFEKRAPKAMSATRIVREIAETDALPIRTLDFFWWLKDQMYDSLIHNPARLVYDGLAQAVVTQDIDDFEPSDFLKDERQLRRTKQRLFTLLDRARESLGKLRKVLPDSILSYEVVVPTRRFVPKASFKPKTVTDLRCRYSQEKTFRRVPVGSLLLSGDSTKCRYPIPQQQFSLTARPDPRTTSKERVGPLGSSSVTQRSSSSVSTAAMHDERLQGART